MIEHVKCFIFAHNIDRNFFQNSGKKLIISILFTVKCSCDISIKANISLVYINLCNTFKLLTQLLTIFLINKCIYVIFENYEFNKTV